jgi:hypothetical protein
MEERCRGTMKLELIPIAKKLIANESGLQPLTRREKRCRRDLLCWFCENVPEFAPRPPDQVEKATQKMADINAGLLFDHSSDDFGWEFEVE